MKSPIFARSLSDRERECLQAGLRSKYAFTLRRSQMLLASSRGEEVPKIAEGLREMLHRSPREFGRHSSLWTLEMAAEIAFEQGLVKKRVSGETVRATLSRLLGVRWMRAKRWITSPDPLY